MYPKTYERSGLSHLVNKFIPRCYFPKEFKIATIHGFSDGFSDASEKAYAGVRLVTSEIIYCLSRRGKPTLMCSDHGRNFVGQIKELYNFLSLTKTSELFSTQKIKWEFRAPHFGGLWEAASCKKHLSRTFEEMTTVLTQIEACLNSRPLTRDDDDEY